MKTLVSIFQAGKDTISCKRVCGFFGWCTICYCAVSGTEVSFMDSLIAGTVVLLGVETVTNIFRKEA